MSLANSSNVQIAVAGVAVEASGTFAVAVVWAGAVVARNANTSKADANGSVLILMTPSCFGQGQEVTEHRNGDGRQWWAGHS
jgi:hypothetical protein